jgi:hypothetical protein
MGQAWKPSKKECYFVNRGDLDSKVRSLSIGLKTAACNYRLKILKKSLFKNEK